MIIHRGPRLKVAVSESWGLGSRSGGGQWWKWTGLILQANISFEKGISLLTCFPFPGSMVACGMVLSREHCTGSPGNGLLSRLPHSLAKWPQAHLSKASLVSSVKKDRWGSWKAHSLFLHMIPINRSLGHRGAHRYPGLLLIQTMCLFGIGRWCPESTARHFRCPSLPG